MQVKVGTELSEPRSVPGGSPQGSILGNFLFCVATSVLAEAAYSEDSMNMSRTVSFNQNGMTGSDI